MRISDWSSDVCSSDLYGVSVTDLADALERSNLSAGSNYVRRAGESFLVRADARLRSVADIEEAVIATRAGVPVRVKDVGQVVIGGAVRTGSGRSEEHTSELQSLMRISYAVFCLKKIN